MNNELVPRDQSALAQHLDVPGGVDPGDLQLAGLAIAALGGAAAEGRTRSLPLPPPIYIQLRRELIRSGEITHRTVPHWPASEWSDR